MNEDELRNMIWDNLYRAKATKSIDELAEYTAQSVPDVRLALNHEWFNVVGDQVSIAYAAANRHDLLG